MAKGYMIFVAGHEAPKVVHKTFDAAMRVMKLMARKCPEQEVFLFQVHKRVKLDTTSNKIKKLGTHMPQKVPVGGIVYVDNLVMKKDGITEISE